MDESQKNFGKAADLTPPGLITNRRVQQADVLVQMKRFDEAHAIYEKMLGENPRNDAALERRARVYIVQGKLDEALDDMNQFLKSHKHNEEGYQQRAKIWKLKKNEEEAQADRKRAEEAAQFWADLRAKHRPKSK